MPVLVLTWTVMHVIDETSPLHGLTAEDLKQAAARLFLSVEARDLTLETQVQAVSVFDAQQVLFDHAYADIVLYDGMSRTEADMRRLSEVEAETTVTPAEAQALSDQAGEPAIGL